MDKLKEIEEMNLETAIKILKSFKVPEQEAYATVFGEKIGYVSDAIILNKAIKIVLEQLEFLKEQLEEKREENMENIAKIINLEIKIRKEEEI